MITVHGVADGGRVTLDMHFESLESANEALSSVGLSDSAVIVDDKGTVHAGVNTYHGFWVENKKKPIRLMVKVGALDRLR